MKLIYSASNIEVTLYKFEKNKHLNIVMLLNHEKLI